MVCIKCHRDLPLKLFGKRGSGHDPRCKECLRESVKLGIRMNYSLPRLERAVKKWPPAQLQSEVDWLIKKLAVIVNEQARRSRP